MSKTKTFIVLDTGKVFIIDSDRDKLLYGGDFVAPPQGYYSIIEKFKGNKGYNQKKSQLLLFKSSEAIINELPFFFMIHKENRDSEYYILEYFNIKHYPFYLISLSHNILPNDLNVNFYNNPQQVFYRDIKVDSNKLLYYLNQVDKIKIEIQFYQIIYRYFAQYKKNYKIILEYDNPYYGSFIHSKGTYNKSTKILFGYDFSWFIKKVIGETIKNEYIDTVDYLQINHKHTMGNFNESYRIYYPNLSFFYIYDNINEQYIIYEKTQPSDNNSSFIYYEIKHDILSSYLDIVYSPPERLIDRVITIPKEDFENAIRYKNYINITLKYRFLFNDNIRERIYKFPLHIYTSIIKNNNYIFNNTRFLYFSDLNYNPNILFLRILDDTGIQNENIPCDSIDLTYYALYPRTIEALYPTRG